MSTSLYYNWSRETPTWSPVYVSKEQLESVKDTSIKYPYSLGYLSDPNQHHYCGYAALAMVAPTAQPLSTERSNGYIHGVNPSNLKAYKSVSCGLLNASGKYGCS